MKIRAIVHLSLIFTTTINVKCKAIHSALKIAKYFKQFADF